MSCRCHPPVGRERYAGIRAPIGGRIALSRKSDWHSLEARPGRGTEKIATPKFRGCFIHSVREKIIKQNIAFRRYRQADRVLASSQTECIQRRSIRQFKCGRGRLMCGLIVSLLGRSYLTVHAARLLATTANACRRTAWTVD